MSEWDESVDFLVVGSGAAGLAGAVRAHDLGLSTLVVEAGDQYGGSTAMSGGVCWVGNNKHINAAGIPDNDEDTLTYLKHITEGEISDERLETYARESKRMVEYFDDNTHLRFKSLVKYTDYYPEAPGGRPGGRSMECPVFDARVLGTEEFRRLRKPHPQSQIMGKFGLTAAEAHGFLVPTINTKFRILSNLIRYFFRFRRWKKFGRDTNLTAGNSLIARLRRSMMDRDIPLWLNAPCADLVIGDGGRVQGAIVERDGKKVRVEAKHGVLLGAGGFSRNQKMREEHQRHPITTEWTAGAPDNMGRGIEMGVEAGGHLELMKEAWWTPTTLVPRETLAWVLVVEKSLPGGIFVNKHGERFTNEAAPYIDVVVGMYDANDDQNATVPAWMVFDSWYRKNYPVGPLAPGYAAPDKAVPRRYRDGFLTRAESLGELADKIEVPRAVLANTVDRFNDFARKGVDEDFGRGESASDRYYGDHRVKPNPCMRPLEKGPFYAIKIYPGDLGTKGGLVTDTGARVLRESGEPIPGLFAAGNTSASVMGRTYPGAGGTIGPALTFGMLAAESAHADSGVQ